MDITSICKAVRQTLNQRFEGREPATLILGTAGVCVGGIVLRRIIRGGTRTWRLSKQERLKRNFFRLLWAIPPVAAIKIKQEEEAAQSLRSNFAPAPGEDSIVVLPREGRPSKDVLALMDERHARLEAHGIANHHMPFSSKQITGTVYHGGEELSELVVEALKKTLWSNPLHPQTFPDVRKMESEICAMVVNLFKGPRADLATGLGAGVPTVAGIARGDQGACASMSSGGTESICLAMRAYREWGAANKGIDRPEIVAPRSAHAAFDKSADYFGMKLVSVPTLPDGRADVKAMARAITRNTVAIVGSAPSYPWGQVDDIPKLAALARKHKVGLHVDCCLGSFMMPFMAAAGVDDIPAFDFSVEGVTSISCDTHKYGFGPKGTSVLMWRWQSLRRFQYYATADWPGGVYATPGVSGSRPGSLVAGTWATMVYMGQEGYANAARAIVRTVRTIIDRCAEIPGIKIPCRISPDLPASTSMTLVVSLISDEFDIFALGEFLGERGWELSSLLFPASLHFGITYIHTTSDEIVDKFVKDVSDGAAKLMALPASERVPKGDLKMYGMSAVIPDRKIVREFAGAFLDSYYESAFDAEAAVRGIGAPPAKNANASA